MNKVQALVKAPHNIVSRDVTNQDIDRVIEDAQKMFKVVKGTCIALAHSQIDDKNPLRFFVTADKIFINPVITRHTKALVDSEEGCQTFIDKPAINVKRHWRIEFDFQVIDMHKLSEVHHEKLKAVNAFVVQHEIDHMNGICIYDEKAS